MNRLPGEIIQFPKKGKQPLLYWVGVLAVWIFVIALFLGLWTLIIILGKIILHQLGVLHG